jgi:hypothetical protein
MRCCFGMTFRVFVLLVGAVPAALWALEENVQMKVHPLRWVMLAIGTICTLHALYDCLHDVLFKKIDNGRQGKSDAVMFADEFCGTARCWGLLWSIIAVAAASAALVGITLLAGDCKVV